MAINPLTWKEEEIFGWPSPVTTDLEGTLSTGISPLNLTATKTVLPEATTANKDQPIVNRGVVNVKSDVAVNPNVPAVGWVSDIWTTDIRTTKLWEVLTDEEKNQLVDKERDRIRNLEWISFEERNKEFRKLQEWIQSWEFFGWETQMEAERARAAWATERLQWQTAAAIKTAEDIFKEDLERETARIQAQGQKVMDTTQRLNSLRWAGRSSANEKSIQEQQTQISWLITAAQRQSDLKLQERRMQIEWASGEAMAAIAESLGANERVLNQRIAEAAKIQKELNDSIWADFQQSMDASLWILSAAWEDVSEIDQAKSSKVWYFVNQDGSMYFNNAGNPVEFKSWVETWEFSPLEIDSFANWISSWKLNFTDLKLDPRDIAKVIAAMNSKLDSKPWLSTNKLKAQRILKDLWLPLDDEAVNTVTNLLKVSSEEDVRGMIATDDFKNASFVAWNQKLFDDLRNDSSSFKDIDRTFKGMDQIWEDFKRNPSSSRAAMEQALIIMFNKMLDPGSVVREWEFDRTSQGQSVINSAEGWLQKLAAGWAWIKNEAFEDIVNIAKVLHKASQDTVSELKDSYKSFAWDLGANPDLVDRFFDTWFGDLSGLNLEDSDNESLDSIFWGSPSTWSTPTQTFKTKSWFQFTPSGFNSPDQTGWTKGIPTSGFSEKVNIARTGTNVAKDTNNPWNITADSIPAWQSKEQYGKAIWATWTYLSPNGREYFVFPDVNSWSNALKRDITAKISGGSRNIKPTDTLARFQRVYVWATEPNYLAVLKRITWASDNTLIKDIDADLLTQAVMRAEWFNS